MIAMTTATIARWKTLRWMLPVVDLNILNWAAEVLDTLGESNEAK